MNSGTVRGNWTPGESESSRAKAKADTHFIRWWRGNYTFVAQLTSYAY